MKKINRGVLYLALPFLFISCQKDSSSDPLVQKGRAIYMSNCISCHNQDPKLPGSIGPDIAFSSLELVRLRVTDTRYPEGYRPKRDTKLMIKFPQLAQDVPAIHAYLNSFSK